MSTPRPHPRVGLPRHRAGWISLGWFLLGMVAILAGALPLQRELRRQVELELLAWLKAEGAVLQPVLAQAERQPEGPLRLPVRRGPASGVTVQPRCASQAQLWLVSAVDREPGLIVPVSADAAEPESLHDFALLQAGIAAARGSATRPFAVVDGEEGRQVVAYLRLVGTGFGISTAVPEPLLYGPVTPRLIALVAGAATLLACACAGLFRLIALPANLDVAGGGDAAPAAGLAGAVALAPPTPTTRLEACLQRILYHADTLAHESVDDPRLREHLTEIRDSARQGLHDLRPPGR